MKRICIYMTRIHLTYLYIFSKKNLLGATNRRGNLRKTEIPHVSLPSLLLEPASVAAEPNLFKISQKRQSSSQSVRASIPATRCLGSIGHLFLCSPSFSAAFSLRLVRSLPAKPKKAPARFLGRVSRGDVFILEHTRGEGISLRRLYRSCLELSTA